jgi:hypothetical protein
MGLYSKSTSSKKKEQYFTQETEDSIVLYNNTLDSIEKSKIYNRKIHYAFFKLTENIIHTFKFYHTENNSIEDLQHEIITFLLSKIHLYDQSKGTKAYSYFGTIVKRYLILNNDKNYKKKIETIQIDTLEDNEIYSYNLDNTSSDEKLNKYLDLYVDYCTKNIYNIFPKKEEAKVADAILELFRKREYLNIFNKKALYIYVKEIIDVKTIKITKIANHLYKIFKNGYAFYLENGYVNF